MTRLQALGRYVPVRQELLRARSAWLSSASETRSASQVGSSASYCCWPKAWVRGMPGCLGEGSLSAVSMSCGAQLF